MFRERVNVIDPQIQMQMTAFIHKRDRRVGSVYELQVETPVASTYSRIEVGMSEFEFQSDLLSIEANAAVEIGGAELRCNGHYSHCRHPPANG